MTLPAEPPPLRRPTSTLYIYDYSTSPQNGENPVSCLPMGSAAFDALTTYYGPPRCEGYCAAGENDEGGTCQACPAGALPLASLSPK